MDRRRQRFRGLLGEPSATGNLFEHFNVEVDGSSSTGPTDDLPVMVDATTCSGCGWYALETVCPICGTDRKFGAKK